MSERKIKGTIVCHRLDDFGEIFVSDCDGVRSLYFGGVLQTSIMPDRPGALVEEYSQAMMSSLIFNPSPGKVLLIGLGGCSIVNFLRLALPECRVDVVEIRQSVIELAREFFLEPKEGPKLRIFHAAGEDFVMGEETGTYDLVLVDAFDDHGPAAALRERHFLRACRQRLTEGGIFAINLWNRPKDNFAVLSECLGEVFEGRTRVLVVGDVYRNAIVLGFCSHANLRELPEYRPVARRLQREYGLNFPRYLKHLYWQNSV